jgi:hypothetical protein
VSEVKCRETKTVGMDSEAVSREIALVDEDSDSARNKWQSLGLVAIVDDDAAVLRSHGRLMKPGSAPGYGG